MPSLPPDSSGPDTSPLRIGTHADAAHYRTAFILVTSLFFLWGLSYGLLDVLNKHFQETMDVSRARSALLQAAYFGAYFIMAIPAATLMQARGYKTGILLGLGLFAAGALLFIPATSAGVFEYFLGALFVIACGLACLETAANPYVTVLGPQEGSERRLNLAQSFNGLGSFVAPLIGGLLFFGGAQRGISASHGVQITYVVIAAVVIALGVLIWRTPLPDIRQRDYDAAGVDAQVPLRSQRHFVFAVITQFFYVAAQVGIGAFFINYVTEHAAGVNSERGAYLLSVALAAFLAGRFLGTAMMGRIAPARLLTVYAIINVALCALVMAGQGWASIIGLMAVFFFMSIMFPTIFALGIKGLGGQTKRGASYLIMAIVGGAIMPWGMGRIADASHSTAGAFIVPLLCFVVVAWYGAFGHVPRRDRSR